MAEVELSPSFGAELKDSFKPVNAWVLSGIEWLDEIQNFYRERSQIEKEYAGKLQVLAKKYHEKKGRKTGSLSVGDTPTLTPGSLESASLTTWTTQLQSLEKMAADRDFYASELIARVSDSLKNVATRYEELRRSHVEYMTKLDKERDAAYVALKRSKGQYDGACQELESKRKKTDSNFDSMKGKAQAAYHQQLQEMHNVKNSYIISINVTNKQKEKHYHEYVPDILDSLQSLSESRVTTLNSTWSLATRLESDCCTKGVNHTREVDTEIQRNNPRLDSAMFMRHNIPNTQEPADMGFEASPVWHDDAQMVVDDAAKVYLRNILGKSKSQRNELKREVDHKRRDVEKARRSQADARDGRGDRDEVEVVRNVFALQESLHESERKWITAEVETSTIIGTVGDISIGAQNHNFKSQTFKIPTNCDLCGERIWGLSAKGFDCRDCGYTCHSKCELKVPADCPGELSKDEKKRLKVERQAAAATVQAPPPAVNGSANSPPDGVAEMPNLDHSSTMGSLSSGYAASAKRSVSGASKAPVEAEGDSPEASAAAVKKPLISSARIGGSRKNRIVAPPPAAYIHEAPAEVPSASTSSAEPRGKMMYAYQAAGEGELSLDEDTEFSILEADDGAGWMTVKTGGKTGVVPASYTETLPQQSLSVAPQSNSRPSSRQSNSSAAALTPTSTSSAAASAAAAAAGAKKKGPAVAPKKGAKKLHFVEALYDYTAQSEVEWSMREGDRFVLVNRDAGDGWADVEKGGQVKSVPANYIQDV